MDPVLSCLEVTNRGERNKCKFTYTGVSPKHQDRMGRGWQGVPLPCSERQGRIRESGLCTELRRKCQSSPDREDGEKGPWEGWEAGGSHP